MTRRLETCEHLALTGNPWYEPPTLWEECLPNSNASVSLRVCLNCGHVGCAEGSPSDHAAHHYAETDHPVAAEVRSEPASRWCYADSRFV